MRFPIPITVLTGFLGSGKTTLLKALLRHPAMAGTAVIVNEFGEVGLDDALIEAADEEMVLLPSGCVCCAVRGDLVAALRSLADRAMGGEIGDISRVVIETTGLADPAPIAHTLMTDEDLFRLYQLDAIIATVDAELGLAQLETQFEPAKQAAVADRLVITKTDRVPAEAVAALRARLHALNPAAVIETAVNGEIVPDRLFGLSHFEPAAVKRDASAWLAAEAYSHDPSACKDATCDHPHDHHDHHRHGDDAAATGAGGHLHGVASFCLTFDEPLDGRKLSFALELLRASHGEKLLRVKGIAAVAGEPLPFVVHGVQHVFYPPTTLESWPWPEGQSRLVFITRGLSEDAVRKVIEPLFSEVRDGDVPRYDGWTAT